MDTKNPKINRFFIKKHQKRLEMSLEFDLAKKSCELLIKDYELISRQFRPADILSNETTLSKEP